jgi:hypothetical protein
VPPHRRCPRRGEMLTGEVAVRCRKGWAQSCAVVVAARAEFGGYSSESRSVSGTVVDDGRWYICRLDYDHGAQPQLSNPHTNVRWEVQNGSHGNMDVHYTFLGRKTRAVTGGQDPDGNVTPPGSACMPQ